MKSVDGRAYQLSHSGHQVTYTGPGDSASVEAPPSCPPMSPKPAAMCPPGSEVDTCQVTKKGIQNHEHVNLTYCSLNVLWTNVDQVNAAKMFHQRRVILLLSYSFASFVWFIHQEVKYVRIVSVSIICRVMETVWGRVMLGTWRCAATTGAGPTRAWRPHTWCPGPWWPPPPTPAPWWRPRLSSSAPTPRLTAGVEVSAVLSIAIITQESGSQDKQYTSIFLLFSYEAFYFLSICPKVT